MHFFPSSGVADWMIWLALAVFFIIIEVSTVNLISVWFALGALIAMGIALLGVGPVWQIGSFVLVSVAALLLFLHFRTKLNITTKTIEKTNADRNVGKTGVVIEKIDPLSSTGQVRVQGQIWSALSDNDFIIEKNEVVEVIEIKGVKLIVRKKQKTDS
ncbi:NfeD family protein [Candidatus Nomurabacteria bacterium]|nr:NfeD family protein [Candidatus Nomurabacteria bacterium]